MTDEEARRLERALLRVAELERLRELAQHSLEVFVKDFHALYLATERLVAHLDLEAEFDVAELEDVKAQLHRMLPAFEECEVAKVLERRRKERGTDG